VATLLLIHGVFFDGRFFLNARGEGLARFFLARNYRVLVGDFRAHGKSRWPEGKRRWDWSFDEYAQEDMAALVTHARKVQAGPLFVLCHSMGGYVALAGLGCRPELQEGLSGIAILAAAVNDYSDGGLRKRIMIPAGRLISAMVGRFPARRLSLGADDEPPALMKQFAEWASQGSFASRDGRVDYWRALGEVRIPVFSGIGAADIFHASPARARKLFDRLGSADKEFVIFGRSEGQSRDFGHVDIAKGEAAEREVLPRIDGWMQARRSPST
jgi:predicted alpha/beta hydrolase